MHENLDTFKNNSDWAPTQQPTSKTVIDYHAMINFFNRTSLDYQFSETEEIYKSFINTAGLIQEYISTPTDGLKGQIREEIGYLVVDLEERPKDQKVENELGMLINLKSQFV